MAIIKQTVETRQCDFCKDVAPSSAEPHSISFDADRWQLDLCHQHLTEVAEAISAIGEKGRRPRARSTRRQRESDWQYLERLGFTRHRGRRSRAELDALRDRSVP